MPERTRTRARAHASEGAPAAVGSQCLCNFLLNILTRTAQFWQNAWDCVNQMVLGCSVFPTANSSGGRGRTGHCPQSCRQHISGKKSSSLSIKIHTALSLSSEGEQVTTERGITRRWPASPIPDKRGRPSPRDLLPRGTPPRLRPPGSGRYLRLAGEGHAEDGDAAEDTLPAHVADSPQPLPTEQAVLEGGQHDLHEDKKGELRADQHTRHKSGPPRRAEYRGRGHATGRWPHAPLWRDLVPLAGVPHPWFPALHCVTSWTHRASAASEAAACALNTRGRADGAQ